MSLCPSCNNEVTQDGNFCPNCGITLKPNKQESKNCYENNQDKANNEMRIQQYSELKSDNREEHILMWSSPIVVTAIATTIISFAFSEEFSLGYEARLLIITLGIAINTSLFVGLCRHRFFQIYRFHIISELEKNLGLVNESKSADKIITDSKYHKPTGWVHRQDEYEWLVFVHVLTVSALVTVLVYLIFNETLSSIVSFILSFVVLYIIRKNLKSPFSKSK